VRDPPLKSGDMLPREEGLQNFVGCNKRRFLVRKISAKDEKIVELILGKKI
jgi:hypothetical protein